MSDVEILIQRLDDGLPLPERAHPGDSGFDLRSTVDLALAPGERALVPTGIAVAIPLGFAGLVQPRSGLAARHGIGIVNAPGLIDAGYRGELRVLLLNADPAATFAIAPGDRIAQLVIVRVEPALPVEVEALEESERGSRGFGSSGVRG